MTRARYIDPGEPPPEYPERMWDAVTARRHERARGRDRRRRAVTVVGALAVAAALVLVLVTVRRPGPTPVWVGNTIETQGKASSLRLVDGTEVEVAPASRLELLAGSASELRLALRHGRATFDVATRPERRFVVSTPSAEVVVVGTRFTVVCEPIDTGVQTQVVVERGQVEVRAGDGEVRRLSAGQSWSTARRPDPVAVPVVPSVAAPEPSMVVSASPAIRRPTAARLLAEANAARARGDTTAAMRHYEQLVQLFPEDPAASLAALELGRLRLRHGDPASAARDLQRSLSADPESPLREDSLANLVEAHERAGERDHCRAARARYLAEFPRGVRSAEVRRRCLTVE